MAGDDAPQLPLTARRKWLVGAGAALLAGQLIAAMLLGPVTTGTDASAGVLAIIVAASLPLCVLCTLLLVRQADMPDVATAAFVVTIAPYAAFALAAALDARGTTSEVDLVDALFLGVTVGALMALLVWGAAMAVARALRLPTTRALRDAG